MESLDRRDVLHGFKEKAPEEGAFYIPEWLMSAILSDS
jgi:hypothetical protein